jgi:4-amino-4-deoxy-L-arabinose transferase-like glycosyltransferase
MQRTAAGTGGWLRDPRTALAVAIGLGLAVRLLRVADWPLIHPDGPAYLALARAVLDGAWWAVLGGYYSPLYPIAIAPLHAVGVPLELAGRLVAALAGVLALPLLFRIARRVGGDAIAAVAILLAAVQPALVKSSAQVLPETLAGGLLLAWAAVLMDARDVRHAVAAGLLAGATYLARPEGVLLLAIGAVWIALRRRAVRAAPVAVAGYVVGALLVMAPALVALHARTGSWQISRREAALVVQAGIASDATLASALRAHPGTLLAHWAAGVAEQTWDTAVAIGPVLAMPLVAGLRALPPAWPLAVAGAFVAGPLALNPSPRYAVPVLPLVLPWVAAGALGLAARLGRRAAPVCAALAVVLVAQGLWRSKPFDEACSRDVRDLLLARYGPGQALVAVDGRFAYVAEGKAIVPKTTQPRVALALAREQRARLWLTRPHWLGRSFVAPPGVREVARPCRGAFVLFEVDLAAEE